MKAVKRPILIEVWEFQPGSEAPLSVQIRTTVNGVGPRYQVLNNLHGSWIDVKPGDYLNVTDTSGRDIYPIDRKTFEQTYDLVAFD